jgi:predicted regulator of Ras-like GTPase activity (Roadblock/LC7/MglB family)
LKGRVPSYEVLACGAMDAAQALADLTEISSQIQAAALVDGEGRIAASTLPDEARAQEFARVARELLGAAEAVRSAGGDALTQLEVATAEGSVFVVRDGDRAIVATTSAEPTVGLVFYDLKSCLRSAADETPPEEPKSDEPKPKRRRKKADEAPPPPEDDAS